MDVTKSIQIYFKEFTKHKKSKGTFYPFDGSKALFLIWMEEE